MLSDLIAAHIGELERMGSWPIHRILPNHGAPDRIAAGGYEMSLIAANKRYLERLAKASSEERLTDFIADDIASGAVTYFEPYEAVHQENIAAVKGVAA